jgi:hypothetical protein
MLDSDKCVHPGRGLPLCPQSQSAGTLELRATPKMLLSPLWPGFREYINIRPDVEKGTTIPPAVLKELQAVPRNYNVVLEQVELKVVYRDELENKTRQRPLPMLSTLV